MMAMATNESIPKPTRCFPNLLEITLHKSKSMSKSKGSSSSSSSSASASASRTKEDELREVFQHFDMDKDGKISSVELRRYFASVGEKMSEEDADGVIHELDSDKDGVIDFDDFVKLMEGDEEDEEDLKKVFERFEEEKGCGRITPKGLQRGLSSIGDFKSYNECVIMIQVYDIDGDGQLNFYEFHQMMAS